MKLTPCFGFALLLLGAPLAFAACGDDAGPSNNGGTNAGGNAGAGGDDGAVECQVVGELCHEADTGSGPAHDCHEVGHEGDAAVCSSEFAKCIGICVPDAGGAASGLDPKCAALGELCHAVDDKTGPLHACHELGHDGEATACAKGFDACATACLAARAGLETGAGGSGGAGGQGGASSELGGAATAGAATAGGATAGGAGGVAGAGGSP